MGWVKNFGTRNAISRKPSGYRGPTQQKWPSRTSVIPGGVGITTNMFNAIEEFLADFSGNAERFRYGEQAMVMLLARTNLGFAQAMSRGPVDPGQTGQSFGGYKYVGSPGGGIQKVPQWGSGHAWKIPVRRITSRYYHGWKVKRIAPNIWEVYNESREAYFIEYGIHPTSPNAVPRRIRKKSALRTLHFAAQTNMAHRMLDGVFGPRTGAAFAAQERMLSSMQGNY